VRDFRVSIRALQRRHAGNIAVESRCKNLLEQSKVYERATDEAYRGRLRENIAAQIAGIARAHDWEKP